MHFANSASSGSFCWLVRRKQQKAYLMWVMLVGFSRVSRVSKLRVSVRIRVSLDVDEDGAYKRRLRPLRPPDLITL